MMGACMLCCPAQWAAAVGGHNGCSQPPSKDHEKQRPRSPTRPALSEPGPLPTARWHWPQHPLTMQPGHFSLSFLAMPVMVPPVPAEATNMSSFPGRETHQASAQQAEPPGQGSRAGRGVLRPPLRSQQSPACQTREFSHAKPRSANASVVPAPRHRPTPASPRGLGTRSWETSRESHHG